MEIKAATLEDIDRIIELGNSVGEFEVSDKTVAFWPKDVLMDCIGSKNSPILVAIDNNHIVGFIIANYSQSFKKAIIENIFVKQDFRGQEVGRLLLDDLITRLRSLGCQYVCSLCELEKDAAIRFYLKNDFSRGIDCVWLDKILNSSFKR